MKRIFNGKVTVKNFIVAMLSALIIFESVGSMSQIAFANGDENSEQTAQQTEQNSEAPADNNENTENNASNENNENTENNNSEGQETTGTEEAPATAETPAAGTTETPATETETETPAASETETETTEETETPAEPQVVEEPVEPDKPAIEGEVNNDKIRQYNSGVESYNQQVDQYNQAVDAYYDSEVARIARENEEIEKNNQAEQQKVIENEQNNEALKAQYEVDYAQYVKDKALADKVYAKYQMTMEQYNAAIDRSYNQPALKSVEMNANSKEFAVSDTYKITEAEDKSGNAVIVRITHYFEDIDKEYYEEFEIDENDIITLTSASAPLENISAGYAAFYLGTDEDHTMGYWYNNGSILYENARYLNSGWNCGECFEISYKDGANHLHDITDIDIVFNYKWNPLRTYAPYNIPVEPTLVQNEYTPNIMEMLAAPTKKAYLGYLSLMDLLADPDPVIPTPTPGSDPTPDPEPTPTPAPTPDPEPTPVPTPAPATVVTTIVDEQAPLAAAPAEGGQVLGAKRVSTQGAVLGARRGNTGDEAKNIERIIIILIAALGIGCLVSIKKEA